MINFEVSLTFTTLWASSADDQWVIFFYFSLRKTGFDISCKLSPLETICMKCQNLFSRTNKNNISKCRLLKILPRVLSVKVLSINSETIDAVKLLNMMHYVSYLLTETYKVKPGPVYMWSAKDPVLTIWWRSLLFAWREPDHWRIYIGEK